MALGGGTFTEQNKVLPGSYSNFVSAASARAELSERGIATMPMELDWGVDGEVFTVSANDFRKNSRKIFGYDYAHHKNKGLRDLFSNIHTLYVYRVNSGGEKAANAFAAARYSGIRGNALKIVIQQNADSQSKFDVKTLLDSVVVDEQTVSTMAELKENDFVVFKEEAALAVTASTPLTGGTNGTVDGESFQAYADKIESYTYNGMGIVTTDDTVKKLFIAFCRRMRDEMGIKFQLVIYKSPADYMGVINVKNSVSDTGSSEADLVYWVTGVIAGCEVNKTCQNRKYDGSYTVNTDYTQAQLKDAIKAGEFVLHKVNWDVRVLADINSMVSTSETQGDIFKDNQTIRVIDQIANDIAMLFHTKYLGNIPNDAAGRISLWTDIVKHHEHLKDIRAIEDFSDKDVIINEGSSKKAVEIIDLVTIVNSMEQLYMTVTVV